MSKKTVARKPGVVIELHPGLQEFLATPEGQTVDSAELFRLLQRRQYMRATGQESDGWLRDLLYLRYLQDEAPNPLLLYSEEEIHWLIKTAKYSRVASEVAKAGQKLHSLADALHSKNLEALASEAAHVADRRYGPLKWPVLRHGPEQYETPAQVVPLPRKPKVRRGRKDAGNVVVLRAAVRARGPANDSRRA